LTGSIPACGPELPADLERHRGFPGAGRHRDEQAAAPGEDGLHHAIHSDLLIVTLALVDRVVEWSEQLIDLRVGQPDRRSVAAPEVVGSVALHICLLFRQCFSVSTAPRVNGQTLSVWERDV